ncbi:MAG: ribosome-associated translation inhibitor RaiA [Thermoleophilaceae bacterium]|nr:ribosome-associated translation inhibitor RaiA [Thermoleophilaceae bacterium]
MQIEIKGRNGVAVTSEMRAYAMRRFAKVERQSSESARLELELSDEHNPSIAEHCVVDAVFYDKGVKLRASDHAYEMMHAIHEVSDELARQLEKRREKHRHRRDGRKLAINRANALAPIEFEDRMQA